MLFTELFSTTWGERLNGSFEEQSSNLQWNQKIEDDELILQLVVPGFSKSSLLVTVHDNQLVVKGTAPKEKALFPVKNFKWKAKIKDEWDTQETKVTYLSGLLTLRVPMKEEEKSKEKTLPIS